MPVAGLHLSPWSRTPLQGFPDLGIRQGTLLGHPRTWPKLCLVVQQDRGRWWLVNPGGWCVVPWWWNLARLTVSHPSLEFQWIVSASSVNNMLGLSGFSRASWGEFLRGSWRFIRRWQSLQHLCPSWIESPSLLAVQWLTILGCSCSSKLPGRQCQGLHS